MTASLDESTFLMRKRDLEDRIAAAQAKYDAAALQTALGGYGELSEARAELGELKDSMDALDRARRASIAEARAEEEAARLRERNKTIGEARAAATATLKAAKKIQRHLTSLAAAWEGYRRSRDDFSFLIINLVGDDPRHGRRTTDMLSNYNEGPFIFRALRGAGVSGLDDVEMLSAFRTSVKTLPELVDERLSRVLSSASFVIQDFKQEA